MLIRSARVDDVPTILPMVAQICALHEAWDAAKFGFLPHPEQRYQGWLTRLVSSDKSVFLVTEDETALAEKPVLAGFLVATVESEIPIYRLQEYGFIHDLWVEPEYRQAGVARQMVRQAIDQFQQMQIRQIRLDVAVTNTAAQHLFQSCGFRAGTVEMLAEVQLV